MKKKDAIKSESPNKTHEEVMIVKCKSKGGCGNSTAK
jgi:hypothetical protein